MLRIFPSIRRNESCSFARLRANGGFLVSAAFEPHETQPVTNVVVESTSGGRCFLVNPFGASALSVIDSDTGDKVAVSTVKGAAGQFSFPTERGRRYLIVPVAPTLQQFTTHSNCTLVQGHDCVGHDISNHPCDSPAACCNDCAARSGCTSFSWYSGPKLNGTKTCFLKWGCAKLKPWNDTVAGPHVTRPPSSAPPRGRPIRVLPLGDSITFGCGDSLSPACVAEGRGTACTIAQSPCATCAFGYRVRLFNMLNTSQPGRWQFVGTQRTGPRDCGAQGACQHEGHPGWRTTDLSAIVNSTLAPLDPDLILLHIGTNDIGRNNYETSAQAASATSANLQMLIAQLLAAVPNTHIFLASIIAMPASCHFYNHGHTANLTSQEEAYNAEVPKVAAHFGGAKVSFVDMKTQTGLCDMKKSNASGCCPPQLHPDATGYSKMAKVWAAALLAWEPATGSR
jgi:lysophospholipase L1-like esterase